MRLNKYFDKNSSIIFSVITTLLNFSEVFQYNTGTLIMRFGYRAIEVACVASFYKDIKTPWLFVSLFH